VGPAVCFDLGGTLVDRDRDHDMCAYWSERGIRLRRSDAAPVLYRTDRHFMESRPDLWRRADAVFQEQYWGMVHAEFGLVTPPAGVCAAWGGPWNVYPDAWCALRELRRSGCRLALISNWDDTALRILTLTGLDRYFDAVAVSATLGWEKPSPEIFEWAGARLGVPPSECLHVGDNYWDDVVGARRADMKPVLLHRHPEWCAPPPLPPDVAVVRDLAAAVPYLLRPAHPVAAGL